MADSSAGPPGSSGSGSAVKQREWRAARAQESEMQNVVPNRWFHRLDVSLRGRSVDYFPPFGGSSARCGCHPCVSIHLREFSRFQRPKLATERTEIRGGPSGGDGCQRQMTKVRKRDAIPFFSPGSVFF